MRAEWGFPPAPLLPRLLRERWKDVVLPDWLSAELCLNKKSTCADLGPSVWQRLPVATPRALNSIITIFRSRLEEVQDVPCISADSWPPTVSLLDSGLSARSKNVLRTAGLLDRPRELAALTFSDLLRLRALGTRSALEICCVLESVVATQTTVVNDLPLFKPGSAAEDWVAELSVAAREPWADQISNADPRFDDLLLGRFGTLQDRIERCLAEPTSTRAAAEGRLLAAQLPQIRERVTRIEQLKLDEALQDLLAAATKRRHNSYHALLLRFGWDGQPPRTLEESGTPLGITRERVRQIERKVLRKISTHPLYLPRLDQALVMLEDASPIGVVQGEHILMSSGVSAQPFSADSTIATGRLLARETDLHIVQLPKDRVIASSKSSGMARRASKAARRLAGMAGVASVFQVDNELGEKGVETTVDAIRGVLKGIANVEFLNEDWFWVTDIPVGRNRLSNVTKKILSVASPQNVGSIREGVRRAFLYRSKSDVRYAALTTPPAEVLSAFFRHSPEYKVAADMVTLTEQVDYREELGEVDQAFVDILRASPTGVLDRKSVVDACLAKGLNENSVSLFLTYSPIIEHMGIDVWKLRGVHVDPVSIEALREANLMAPREKRLLSFGWRPDGKLWIAARLPYSTTSLVLGVPGGFKRFLANRTFRASDRGSGKSCGQISVNDAGSSFGYSPFLRLAGADAGDVLLAEFDITNELVELRLADDLALEADYADV